MSLRTKFFLMLGIGPLVSLLLFLGVASFVFMSDKISYVLDMQISQVNQLSSSIFNFAESRKLKSLKDVDLSSLMPSRDYLNFYVVDTDGEILATSLSENPGNIYDVVSQSTAKKLFSEPTSLASFEGQDESRNTALVTYRYIPDLKIFTISLMKKSVIYRTIVFFLTRSLGVFLIILAACFIISRYVSKRMTARIEKIRDFAGRVEQGEFESKHGLQGRDELYSLGESLQTMASRISLLLNEKIDKVRMEKELDMAKTVQDSLFPANLVEFEKVTIHGFYASASECGGDWWHCCEIGDKVFIWVGDATGHGAPAALITSAAKSISTVVESMGEEASPAQAMSMLNKAIHYCSKGNVCMTFFIGAYDRVTGELTFCNASHEVPYRMGYWEEGEKEFSLEPIIGQTYSRLGENPESGYKDEKIKLDQGEMIFFYTDGVTELFDSKGEMFGERRLVRALKKGALLQQGGSGVMQNLKKVLQSFQKEAVLQDDVTYVLCQFH